MGVGFGIGVLSLIKIIKQRTNISMIYPNLIRDSV
jgi:hypothetical protein